MKTPSTILFQQSGPEINISITASITEEDHLLFEGYDSGALVKKLKGKSDYEYNMLVKKDQKEALKQKLHRETNSSFDDQKLLEWLKENYNHNEAFSAVEFLLDRLDVNYESFNW